MPELVFNALLLGVDAVGLAILRKRPGPRLFLGVALVCATLSVPLSLLVWVVSGWRTAFGIMRLGAWAVFLHGFVLLLGGAACLRRRHRRCAVACLLGAVALVLVAVDAFLIEPTALEVTRYEIVTPKLSRPVRIGILADLQTDRIGGYERRAVELLLAEEPDLLLLLGDYVQGLDQEAYDTLEHELNALLSDVGFDAPLGCFAVRGNVER
ncbi:MAG: hypothetical protein O7B99_09535, partial [Planctomycetota bacterium]|nr:hypothetical protein [Planctomycetota bacterium]